MNSLGLQEQIDFLNEWPLNRLEAITLEQYTNLERKSSFTYWLETKTENTGSIWGGSAYKFGIFRRLNTDTMSGDERLSTDGVYSWYSKYGKTRDEAFQKVKTYIISIAKNSIAGDFDKIDAIDLGEAYKWKIAFLYNTSNLIPVFKKEMLERASENLGLTDAKRKAISELQKFLFKHKNENETTLEYAESIWKVYSLDNFYYVVDKFLKQAETNDLKQKGFPKTYKNLEVKVSFGIGNTAKIPWIALLKSPNYVSDGIYPVYLFYKEINTLILAYGVSETYESVNKWKDSDKYETIEQWYLNKYKKKPERYGNSYIKAVYNLEEELNIQELQKDLDEIIELYKQLKFEKSTIVAEGEEEYQVKRYWLVAPGPNANYWDYFYNNGTIGIGWTNINDLTQYDNKETIRQYLVENDLDVKSTKSNDALCLWEFSKVMKPGDIVIVKKGTTDYLGYGIVNSDYYFDASEDYYKHLRKVDWKKKGIWPADTGPIVLKTLTDITKYPGYVDRLKRFIGIEQEAVIPSKINYWWLNANPKYWKIEDFEVGQEQSYTTINDNGNKRSKYEYFKAAKPGDLIIGYESSPIKKIVAILEVTKSIHIDEDDGVEKISFSILKFLPTPITWKECNDMKELENCEVLKNNQGSLFKLEKNEFDALVNRETISDFPEYTKEEALKEIFIEEIALDEIIESLEYKKNIILQGPPGVGKTFMAKRLAFLLMGEKDTSKIEMIQFHQSYSYEDFMQGYRPTDDGNFKLENGVFYRFCKKAQSDLNKKYFFIIDEINRGNMSKIFGELMLLIENDKRGEKFAVPLTYSLSNEIRFYIPENVYIIGTMNTADRSLAVVDYALRRRFAFIDVEPNFDSKFESHLRNSVDEGIISKIKEKFTRLNQLIEQDRNLGSGFKIGHSYFCNANNMAGDEDWYRFVIKHEIGPLLKEYWFDNPELAKSHFENLL